MLIQQNSNTNDPAKLSAAAIEAAEKGDETALTLATRAGFQLSAAERDQLNARVQELLDKHPKPRGNVIATVNLP